MTAKAAQATNLHIRQVRKLFPIVLHGRTAWLLIGELFYLFTVLLTSVMMGESTSSIIKSTLIFPPMLLIAFCLSDLVSSLRKDGDLELLITLSHPMHMLVHRMVPILSIAVGQLLAVSLFLAFIRNPLHIGVGLAASVIPLAMAATASLFWNLRLRGAGAVLSATVLTLIPAMIWIGSAHVILEKENILEVSLFDVIFSCLLSQAGVLAGACMFAALAMRRLQRPEKVLGE